MKKSRAELSHLVTSIVVGFIVATMLFLLAFVTHTQLTPESARLSIQDHAQLVSNILFPEEEPVHPKLRLLSLPSESDGLAARVRRIDVANAVRQVDLAGAKVIVLDVDLSGPSEGNADLSNALASLQNAVVIVNLQLAPQRSGQCTERTDGAPASVRQLAWPLSDDPSRWTRVRFASAEFEYDSDYVVRSFCPFTTAWFTASNLDRPQKLTIPSFALVAVAHARAEALPARWSEALAREGKLKGLPPPDISNLLPTDFEPRRIHFALEERRDDNPDAPVIAPGVVRYPSDNLLNEQADLSDLSEAIVIIGSDDPANGDRLRTPLREMSGLLLSANTIAAVLRADFLAEQQHGFSALALELVLVLAGSILFFTLNNSLPGLVLHRRAGLTGRGWATIFSALSILWFLLATLVVGFLFVQVSIFVAAWGVTRGVLPDPAAAVLSVIAERLIHAGATLEAHVHRMVENTLNRLARRAILSETTDADEEAGL